MSVTITKNNGEIVDPKYIAKRVSSGLRLWRHIYGKEHCAEVVAKTIKNKEWMTARNGYTVAGLVRDIEREI